MVKVKEDITGRTFSKLTVLYQVEDYITPSGKRYDRWACRCACGNPDIFIVLGQSLKMNHTKSCGCLAIEKSKERFTKHGGSYDKLYNVRTEIIERCCNPNNKRYKDYGGRGIQICDEWRTDYQAFKRWAIENGYKEGLSIDRKDNDGNYEPDNCRWVTNKAQANNKRTNRYIEFNGERKTIAEWADMFGLKYDTLYGRLFTKNWDIEKALLTPVHKQKGGCCESS